MGEKKVAFDMIEVKRILAFIKEQRERIIAIQKDVDSLALLREDLTDSQSRLWNLQEFLHRKIEKVKGE